ncbi:hypothetical protein K503DRAFT_784976 [Rhizopogon vinicolor AM-OR11-026]|uniref:Uncharacterized protein n=1 Tax=Rhizopogon vinicolor AM-OR11-026 TaxID=1314800 RepID=A0A1B7MSK7_9AGAM|nr:hypothetical protein K503DRAFT_784976 [Rhizopogon vinicolor AM-OR11-026]
MLIAPLGVLDPTSYRALLAGSLLPAAHRRYKNYLLDSITTQTRCDANFETHGISRTAGTAESSQFKSYIPTAYLALEKLNDLTMMSHPGSCLPYAQALVQRDCSRCSRDATTGKSGCGAANDKCTARASLTWRALAAPGLDEEGVQDVEDA